eukprot:2879756-Rhodomonas_salina.2
MRRYRHWHLKKPPASTARGGHNASGSRQSGRENYLPAFPFTAGGTIGWTPRSTGRVRSGGGVRGGGKLGSGGQGGDGAARTRRGINAEAGSREGSDSEVPAMKAPAARATLSTTPSDEWAEVNLARAWQRGTR